MAEENWSFQASFKTPSGHMINVRANDSLDFIAKLKDLPVDEILAQGALVFGGSYAAEQLTTPQIPAQRSAPTVEAVAAVPPAPAGEHTCNHGQRVFKQGTNAQGKAWAGWLCAAPKGAADKCQAEWVKA